MLLYVQRESGDDLQREGDADCCLWKQENRWTTHRCMVACRMTTAEKLKKEEHFSDFFFFFFKKLRPALSGQEVIQLQLM